MREGSDAYAHLFSVGDETREGSKKSLSVPEERERAEGNVAFTDKESVSGEEVSCRILSRVITSN